MCEGGGGVGCAVCEETRVTEEHHTRFRLCSGETRATQPSLPTAHSVRKSPAPHITIAPPPSPGTHTSSSYTHPPNPPGWCWRWAWAPPGASFARRAT